MPYISTEEVRKIRNALKENVPECKFSVKCQHKSSVCVTILKSKLDMLKASEDYVDINPYHYKEQDYSDVLKSLFTKIYSVIDEAHPNKIISNDADYGSIPNYYLNLQIGNYKKPYEMVK